MISDTTSKCNGEFSLVTADGHFNLPIGVYLGTYEYELQFTEVKQTPKNYLIIVFHEPFNYHGKSTQGCVCV